MRIYVDFDDVLCETAQGLLVLANRLFARDVLYRNVRDFDLKVTFSLSDDEYLHLMAEAHTPEFLLGLEETPGAVAVINAWLAEGHDVVIVTGRPVSTAASSRQWLAGRGLQGTGLMHVDKYGRFRHWPLPAGEHRAFSADEFKKEHFDWAVEDAPAGLDLLRAMPGVKPIVFDRPWNADYPATPPLIRCDSWRKIGEIAG